MARIIMSHHMYHDGLLSLKEVGGVIRPKRPLDHTTILWYNKRFIDLQAIRDAGFLVTLADFLLSYKTVKDSFTTNPTQ